MALDQFFSPVYAFTLIAIAVVAVILYYNIRKMSRHTIEAEKSEAVRWAKFDAKLDRIVDDIAVMKEAERDNYKNIRDIQGVQSDHGHRLDNYGKQIDKIWVYIDDMRNTKPP